MTKVQRIAVFCGSSEGLRPAYREAAETVGELLAERGTGLVYGGGRAGLMGALADSCLRCGGQVTGVMPRSLVAREVAHRGLTELHVVESMHERKALMASLSDAFFILPGGFGTWDELCEALTWSQLGLQSKPCGLLNVEGYYDAFIAMVSRAVSDGFVREAHRELLITGSDPARVLDRLERWLSGNNPRS